jgi:hypothetical protein
MSSLIRKEFHSDIASLLLNEIQYQKSAFYYFLGKSEAQETEVYAPITPEPNSFLEDTKIRTNALYFKKISPNEVTLVTKRYNWVLGEIYSAWDHSVDNSNNNFYVFTSEDHNVYKCLDNNNGLPSTVEPTGKSFLPFRTSDGYLWKFMYAVPNFKRKQFASSSFLPVQRALTDSFYNRGAIEQVGILNPGSGYTDVPLSNIIVSGGTTTGSGATLSITSFGAAGSITGIDVTTGGSGYTLGAYVVVTSINGRDARIDLDITAGVVTGATITYGGYGYTTGDIATVEVGGASFFPVISRSTHGLVDVITTNPGKGYLTAPTLTLVSSVGTPSGLYPGNASAILEPILVNGMIERVLIRDPGVGYSVDTSTTIVVTGDGTGASVSPVVMDGVIVDVIVENSGSGYTNVKLSVLGAGTGAALSATVAASDYQSEQSIVEQTAVDGAIYLVKMVTNGQDYTSTTTMTIDGDGTGASGHVIVENGQIKQVVMDSYGSGYTFANIKFTDPNRYDPLLTKQIASAYAVLPPRGGHGKDAVIELYADTLAISSRLQADHQLNMIDQDFRQFGIIRNPRNLQTGVLFKGISHLSVFEVLFQSTVGLVVNELLTIGQTTFRVIWFDSERVMLQRTSPKVMTPIGELVAASDSLRTYTCYRVVSQPVLNKYSGNLLYATGENPFVFAENQGVLVKTFIKI